MKNSKLALALAVAISATISLPSHAGLFDSVVTSGWGERPIAAKYKIDTHGFNVRVYEWTPKYNKDVRCVFVAGSENSSGNACYNVEEMKKAKK